MSQKRTESKEHPAEGAWDDCDPSKMSPIFAKNLKKTNQEQQTKQNTSDALLTISKESSSRKMVHGNISSKGANPCSPSCEKGEMKRKPLNPRKPKIAKPTLPKRLPKIKADKNPSTDLQTGDNENYDHGDEETTKRDKKESAKRNVGSRCRNIEPRSSKKTCRAKQGRQTS